jgi:hypothetical protein
MNKHFSLILFAVKQTQSFENFNENSNLSKKNSSIRYQRGSSYDTLASELEMKIRRSHENLKQINQKINENESFTNLSKNNSFKTDVNLFFFSIKIYIDFGLNQN